MMFPMSSTCFHETQTAHDILLGLVLDEVAAGVGVVLFQRLKDLLQRDLERREPVRVDDDLDIASPDRRTN